MNQLAPATPASNATVMASAGTGKTWLLVTRLVRLLLDGARPGGILAITFTRKAAAEMQTRLTQRLYEMAAADSQQLATLLAQQGVTDTKANREQARILYEQLLRTPQTVRTSTFHAFCQEILRRFPLEAGIPPGFELLESSALLQQEAWDALFSEATRSPDAALARALETLFNHCGSLFNTQTALMDFLQHRSDWWAFTDNQNDPAGFARNKLQSQLGIDPDVHPVSNFFSPRRRDQLLEFGRLLARHKTKTNMEQAESLFRILEAEASEQRFTELRQLFLTRENEPRKRKPAKAQAKAMGEQGQQRFLQLHETLSRAILDTFRQLAARRTLDLSSAWFLAGHRLIAHYQRIKEEQRLLDFADLEWKSYKLLSTAGNAHWVQYKLDQRIDHLLIDEFQDTNPTQWRLILPLLEEMAAGEPERPRSVFLVGDSKQSIYRFRRAEPRLFDTAHRWLAEHLDADSYPMDKSWRSAPAIMQFVNELYGSGELNQQLPHFHPHDTHHPHLWGRVELLPLVECGACDAAPTNGELRNPLQQPRIVQTDRRYYREGEQIAATIRSLVEQPVIIDDSGEARPVNLDDILVLIARRTHLPDIEAALRDAGIPYQSADRGTLLESQEVKDMEALLETLVAPYHNLSLAVVLRSPLFACSDQDLITLAGKGPGSWWERLMALSSSPAGRPLARARRWLREWQLLAGHLPVHDLLQRIYSEGNVPARYEAAFPAHLRPRVRANLERFLQLALEVDSGRYPSLMHFIARLQDLRELKQDAPDEAPTGGGAPRLRLMTIHAAKGLEAPVVFLADSASSNTRNNSWSALVNWPAEQDRPSHFLLAGKKQDSDPLTLSLFEEQTKAQQREDANLLYVAITRARQLLYLSASTPGRGGNLGWYGMIREKFGDRLNGEKNGVLCESGTPSTSRQTRKPEPPFSNEQPDPRLHSPLHLSPVSQEIAPSRQGDHQPGKGDPDGRLRGTIIHRMLELLTREPAIREEDLLQQISAEMTINGGATLLLECQQEARKVIQEPRLQPLFDDRLYTSTYNEIPLVYEMDGKTIHGIIDRLLVGDHTVTLIDYKTHRSATTETVAQLATLYRQQMALYANGIQRLWPEKTVRSLLLFTACRHVFEIEQQAQSDRRGSV